MLAVSGRLPCDYTLALLLAEHRALTTPQITAVLLGSPYICRNRLHLLRLLRLLDRFIPHWPRHRAPIHWIIGPLAARYDALHHDPRGSPASLTSPGLRSRAMLMLTFGVPSMTWRGR